MEPTWLDPQGRISGNANKKLHILLVDDDERCLQSLESILAPEGHDLFFATRGLEALECARSLKDRRVPLDLSILDFNMPDLNGIETFRKLVVEFPVVEGIFISGEESRDLENEVRLAGGRVLVRKPLDLIRVRSAVSELASS
jgi:DNA-binding response OmpR family regulator